MKQEKRGLARGRELATYCPRMRSLWLDEALAGGADLAPPLRGSIRADVCIVGGGYTGLWTALALKERQPSLDVALLEAGTCGEGASGRNGGFVLPWWPKFPAMAKLWGAQEALTLCRASADAVTRIGKFCAEHGIDAGFRADGHLWAATNETQMGAWRPAMDALARWGAEPFVELGPEEAASRSGSPVHLGGALDPAAAVVQPARLARGLRRVALERGVRIHESSAMTELAEGTRLRIRTFGGEVDAERVVLAMNAWAVRFPEVRRRMVVVGSDMVSTDPIPGRLAEIGWVDGLAISDSRLLVHYYRTTEDGRIAFGKGGGELALAGTLGARFEGGSPRRAEVEAAFRATYPDLADVAVPLSWTGPVDRSRTGLPFFGPLRGRPNVVVGAGYSGNGVGPSFLGGQILASLALDADDEWSSGPLVGLPPGRFPPEPFRHLGGRVVRSAIARKERAEDASRPVGRITRRLVRLAPAGLVPVKRP